MNARSAQGSRWAIATPHTAATDAGVMAFERGGNAIDAALAAATTLAVTYPHMCGVGGDLFALVQEPDGETIAVASSGRAPADVDVDEVRRSHQVMPDAGPIPVTVPGVAAGWRALHGLGAGLPWEDAFADAIRLAVDGVALARSVADDLEEDDGTLAADPGIAAIFFPEAAPLTEGDVLRNPALGATLEQLATEGPDVLYRGSVGRRYVDGLRALGSPLRTDDLARHEAELLPPLRAAFRDHHVSVAPPNSQGFVLLQIVALVERLGIDPDPTGPDAGTLAHVFRVASADRDRHLADVDAMRAHVSTILDDGHMAALADEVRAGAGVPPGRDPAAAAAPVPHRARGGDTIALVAIDGSGYAVSLIQSLFDSFGAKILEPSTGIVAHDRGACFVLDPDHPNVLAPGKRPAHTLLPVIVHGPDGRVSAVAGTKGGHGQPQIDAQTLIRSLAHGDGSADAVAAPRWLVGGMDPMPVDDPWIRAEADLPEATMESFRAAGFDVRVVPARDEGLGHAHLIRADGRGFDAGSDPRADGSAAAG